MDYAKESLKMHYDLKGKIEVVSRAKVDSKDALSLAYTPGVAQPCLEIQKDVNKSYDLTRRWNTVAVVTDGRNNYGEYKKMGIEVIGISKDSVKSHANFAAKQELPFILLADPERQAIEAYDVWQEKKLYGKVSMGVVRTTYIVDEKGMIEKAYPNANPDTNAEEILAYLKG